MGQSRPPSKWPMRIAIALVALTVLGIGFLAYAARVALTAERHYQAFLNAYSSTLQFIEESDGDWPTSWDDLAKTSPNSDFSWVSECISFDFNAKPEDIAQQTPDTFTAIQPNEPCYITDDSVRHLIAVLREHHRDASIDFDGSNQ